MEEVLSQRFEYEEAKRAYENAMATVTEDPMSSIDSSKLMSKQESIKSKTFKDSKKKASKKKSNVSSREKTFRTMPVSETIQTVTGRMSGHIQQSNASSELDTIRVKKPDSSNNPLSRESTFDEGTFASAKLI